MGEVVCLFGGLLFLVINVVTGEHFIVESLLKEQNVPQVITESKGNQGGNTSPSMEYIVTSKPLIILSIKMPEDKFEKTKGKDALENTQKAVNESKSSEATVKVEKEEQTTKTMKQNNLIEKQENNVQKQTMQMETQKEQTLTNKASLENENNQSLKENKTQQAGTKKGRSLWDTSFVNSLRPNNNGYTLLNFNSPPMYNNKGEVVRNVISEIKRPPPVLYLVSKVAAKPPTTTKPVMQYPMIKQGISISTNNNRPAKEEVASTQPFQASTENSEDFSKSPTTEHSRTFNYKTTRRRWRPTPSSKAPRINQSRFPIRSTTTKRARRFTGPTRRKTKPTTTEGSGMSTVTTESVEGYLARLVDSAF